MSAPRKICKHEHGDTVAGIWVCGQCWQKLDERPRRYVMVPIHAPLAGRGHEGSNYRQEVILAPVKIAESGLTLSQFIMAVARRIVARSAFMMPDAIAYAIDLMGGFDFEFADANENWSVQGAWEIVREDMEYWDQEDASNDE